MLVVRDYNGSPACVRPAAETKRSSEAMLAAQSLRNHPTQVR